MKYHELRPVKAVTSLRVWIPLSVGLFVLLGSLGLLWVFENHREREEIRAFEELARVNAGFIERTRLPQNDKMAERLSEIIGAQVFYWFPENNGLIGASEESLDPAVLKLNFDGRARVLSDGSIVVGHRTGSAVVVFLRHAERRESAMLGSDAWWGLGIFWVLSLGLGIGLSHHLVRPLRSLVESLPMVGSDDMLKGLPIHRRDEIGRLAYGLQRTHESLREEREMRRMAERHAIIGRMAASLAHEVRNPVAAIRLHTQLLEQANAAEADISQRLILSEAERLEDLVMQWMSYARPAPPNRSMMDVRVVVDQAIDLIKPQASHAGVEIIMDQASEKGVEILADRQRLQQVLGNLLRNAIQAMPLGGRVFVGIEDALDEVRVIVRDEGVGFSDAALAHLGEPFFSEKEGGMGLGLAVVKEICEGHGGRLMAENLTVGGAKISVEFFKS